MLIGIPKEIKNREHRVAMTPEGVAALTAAGHRVRLQAGAGRDSGFDDAAYTRAGAELVEGAAAAWDVDLVVKVKEPLSEEYGFLRPGLALFTFLHLAADLRLARELTDKGVCAIGYETVQLEDGRLPLLAAMSQVAGRVAAQLGVLFLQRENGTAFPGRGILIGGLEGPPTGRAVILGGGNVGRHAAESLVGLGAEVILLEANPAHLQSLRHSFAGRAEAKQYDAETLAALLPGCDLLIGAALVPGEHAPSLLRREDIGWMPEGSVFVDVSIDQGGISETSRPTSYEQPVYVDQGVLHCCLPNLPATVPETSTWALTHATLPYVQKLADFGIDGALAADPALALGVNIREGRVVHAGVADALGFDR